MKLVNSITTQGLSEDYAPVVIRLTRQFLDENKEALFISTPEGGKKYLADHPSSAEGHDKWKALLGSEQAGKYSNFDVVDGQHLIMACLHLLTINVDWGDDAHTGKDYRQGLKFPRCILLLPTCDNDMCWQVPSFPNLRRA
jgi:hypothetical protein